MPVPSPNPSPPTLAPALTLGLGGTAFTLLTLGLAQVSAARRVATVFVSRSRPPGVPGSAGAIASSSHRVGPDPSRTTSTPA